MKKAGGDARSDDEQPHGREGGKLKIELPFEEALKAALEAQPPAKKKGGS